MQTEPWLAVTLSSILPGAGHIYAKRLLMGLGFLTLWAAATFVAFWKFFSSDGDVRVSLLAAVLGLVLWLFCCFHSFRCARLNNSADDELLRKQTKDPWLAVFLSRVFPGLGHVYLKQWDRAIGILIASFGIFFILGIVFYVALGKLGAGEISHSWICQGVNDVFVGIIGGVVGAIAYFSAPMRRETSFKPIVCVQLLYSTVLTILLLSTHYVRENVAEPFYISGRSMTPTLDIADRIITIKCDPKTLHRGDLAIFIPPGEERSVLYVKRLVALGGETVEIRADGHLYIDGKVLDEWPFDQWNYVPFGENGVLLSAYSYTVPRGSYFFLGDNSARSKDCRFYGAIPARDVLGRAYKIWWPLSRARSLTSH